MRQREGTQDLEEAPVESGQLAWGKLLSLNKIKLNSYDLKDREVTVGRNVGNTIRIDDSRLSGSHCKFVYDSDTMCAKLTDLSTNGTFLGDQKIGKGNEIIIKSGDEVFILHKSKVVDADVLGFAFFQEQIKSTISVKDSEENAKNEAKMKKLDELGEDFCCPICDDLLFQAVTLMPCLHNFCGSCFSDWMVKQKTCPSCREDVGSVKQNATINSVIEKFLTANPQRKRPEAEYKMMEENNKIRQTTMKFGDVKPAVPAHVPVPAVPQLVIHPLPAPPARGRGRGKAAVVTVPALKRKVSDYSADSGSDDGKQTIKPPANCQSCKKAVQGFKCGNGQKHVQCARCANSFPDRNLNQADNEKFHHKCSLCNTFICNLVHPECLRSKRNIRQLFLLKDIPVPGIGIHDFRQNAFEHQVLQDYLKSKRLSPQQMFKAFQDQFIEPGHFRYIMNKKINKDTMDNLDIVLSPNSPICNICVPLLWFQIVLRYRISIKMQLPSEVRNRDTCWWGVNCNTMKHNIDHAKKLDHWCEQTKL